MNDHTGILNEMTERRKGEKRLEYRPWPGRTRPPEGGPDRSYPAKAGTPNESRTTANCITIPA
jgi:hypothetical protein